jgi:hypothetical protein
MKMFRFHLPVVGFGENVDDALESAWERLMADPKDAVIGREIVYEELDTREHAAEELSQALSPIRGHGAGVV